MAQPSASMEQERTAEAIFAKLKAKEDKRKQQCWYRVYTFTFNPNGRARRSWDMFLMVLVLYSGFVSPYKAVFMRSPGVHTLHMRWDELLIDGLFYFDIVLNFFTGFDNGYQVVTERKEIAKKYMWFSGRGSGFFWVDFIATVEWDKVVEWITEGGTRVAWLALLKMLKVARMLRFGRLITRVTSHMKVHTGFVEAGKFFVYVFYVAHILACLFFLWSELFECRRSTCEGTAIVPQCRYTVGTDGCPDGCTDNGTTCSGTATRPSCDMDVARREDCPEGCEYTSYMANEWDLEVHAPLFEIQCLEGDPGCDADETRRGEVVQIDHAIMDERNDCVPTSWRHAYSVAGVSINEMMPFSQWCQAFYWAITTMSTIGYGDRGPGNESEIMFTIAAELIGLAFFALLIQTINNLKDVIGLKETQQKEVKNNLVDQMRQNELKDDLIMKVVKFLNFKATSKAGRAFFRDDKDFAELSPALQSEILRSTNYPFVKEMKIFGHSKEDQIEMDSVKLIFEEANDGTDETGAKPSLDKDEIKQLVLKLGVVLTYEMLEDAMSSMDSSGDNKIELEEFQNWWYMQRFHRPRMVKCPESLLLEIAEHLECTPASPGDIIVPKHHYGDKFFVLQAGKVIKRLSTHTYGDMDKSNKSYREVSHKDNDPFFGLQAVLSDTDFEKIRPQLAMVEIEVAEESYVECLGITRENLRFALEKVESVSRKGGRLDRLICKYTDRYDLRARRRANDPPYEDDPAQAVITELTRQIDDRQSYNSEQSDESRISIELKEIQQLRAEAWEWTGVDGKVMRGCKELAQHAVKLTEEVTGASTHGGGPPADVLEEAVRRRALGTGQNADMWRQFQTVRSKVDNLEKKVDKALRHAARTNTILEALAKQQGLEVPAVDADDSVYPGGTADSAPQIVSPHPAPLHARRVDKQRADTRPSPIRRKAEAAGITLASTNP